MTIFAPKTPSRVEILILGAGWTSTFLIPLIKSRGLPYAATTTDGRDNTIPFKFDPADGSVEPYKLLPPARTVLVTFPLTGRDASRRILSLYRAAHGPDNRWIQLGSTGIFTAPQWNDSGSPYKKTDARAIAEDELLALGGAVLNLAGLYGGERDPRGWVKRVARSKEEVKGKKALHLVHGADVARAVMATHDRFMPGKRWLIADLHVYDWWDLVQNWGPEVRQQVREEEGSGAAGELRYEEWVGELMVEENVRALPRSADSLGRVLDSRGFWSTMGIWPEKGRVT